MSWSFVGHSVQVPDGLGHSLRHAHTTSVLLSWVSSVAVSHGGRPLPRRLATHAYQLGKPRIGAQALSRQILGARLGPRTAWTTGCPAAEDSTRTPHQARLANSVGSRQVPKPPAHSEMREARHRPQARWDQCLEGRGARIADTRGAAHLVGSEPVIRRLVAAQWLARHRLRSRENALPQSSSVTLERPGCALQHVGPVLPIPNHGELEVTGQRGAAKRNPLKVTQGAGRAQERRECTVQFGKSGPGTFFDLEDHGSSMLVTLCFVSNRLTQLNAVGRGGRPA